MKPSLCLLLCLGLSVLSPSAAISVEKDRLLDDEVFPGGPTYAVAVTEIGKRWVFPNTLTFLGVEASREKVVAEKVDRIDDTWAVELRASYGGEFRTIPFIETARIKFDDNTVSINRGQLQGKIDDDFIREAASDLEGYIRQNLPGRHPGSEIETGDSVYLHTRAFSPATGFHHYLNAKNGRGNVTTVPRRDADPYKSDQVWWIVKRDAGLLNPKGDSVIHSGDMVYLHSRASDIKSGFNHYLSAGNGNGNARTDSNRELDPAKSDQMWWIIKR